MLNRAFNRVDEYISDFRGIWPSVAAEFYAIEEGQFESEGEKGASGKWAPLGKAYAKFKVVAFPDEPILKATHSLYESMTDPEALDAVYRLEEHELVIGTKVPYALAHQRGRGRMPARPIISLTEADKRRLQKAIQSQLVQFTRRAGFEVQEKAA